VLDHSGIVNQDLAADELAEIADTRTGEDRHLATQSLAQHRGAGPVNREAHARLSVWNNDVASPIPIEKFRRGIVGLSDEPIQRHAHVS
jgi:hypothetical protein